MQSFQDIIESRLESPLSQRAAELWEMLLFDELRRHEDLECFAATYPQRNIYSFAYSWPFS